VVETGEAANSVCSDDLGDSRRSHLQRRGRPVVRGARIGLRWDYSPMNLSRCILYPVGVAVKAPRRLQRVGAVPSGDTATFCLFAPTALCGA
jgi:hypothetical protein